MNEPTPAPDVDAPRHSLSTAFRWWAAVWTGVVALVVVAVLGDSNRAQFAVARIRAEEIARTDFLFHGSDAALGGVYAETSGTIEPDSLLSKVKDRDLTTHSGRKLTLVSPTHRQRLARDWNAGTQRQRGHLVSEHPLNPANAPDAWERQALARLTLAERAIVGTEVVEGQTMLRHLAGVIMQPSCLTCHGEGRGTIGDVIGGISVKVPLDLGPAVAFRPAGAASAGLVSCWILGLLWMNRSARELERRHAESRQARRQFEESDRRFRLVFEDGPLGIVLTDARGRFIQVNRAFAAMLGDTPQALCQRGLLDITHADGRAECEDLLRRSERNPQTPFRLEQCYVGHDGRIVWGNLTAVFLQRDDGQPLWRLGMIEDTTARRLDEVRLREQAALIEIAQDAICVQSLDGRIEFWNPAAEKLYGWTRQEVLGAPGHDLLFGRVSRELLQAQAEVLAVGSWSGELMQAGRGGRLIQTQTRFSLVRDAGGNPKSVLIVSTDLTEHKRLEQQFLRAQRMECIGALASGIAHDLNNVFSPVLMVAECLADRLPAPADAELVELVRTSAERGAGIVRQLLAFSRGQEIDRVELRVEQLLKEMSRLARETFPKSIEFSSHTSPDLWRVVGDVVQIHQVLLNLCVNARDAMPAGGRLTVSASNVRADATFCEMTPEARQGPYVQLEVSDTGEGIPATILDLIFDPFFTTKAPGKGTGLGLPTVLKIVKAHRGFLQVHSRVGEGTRIRVFFPAVPAEEPDTRLARTPRPEQARGERILVLDDEGAVCECVSKVLEFHGYRPIIATNGAEAIRKFAHDQGNVDVVITDLMMPGMEGASFIRAVRKLAPYVPVIVMSGSPEGRAEAEAAGEDRIVFLEKPFTSETLLLALHDALHTDPSLAATNVAR